MTPDPKQMRALAAWYREFAERASNPTIWEGRLRMAEDLIAEADRLEKQTRSRRRSGTAVDGIKADAGP